jgi:hypothetical protein
MSATTRASPAVAYGPLPMRFDEGKVKVQTALRACSGPARCTIPPAGGIGCFGADAAGAVRAPRGVLHDDPVMPGVAIRAKTKPRLGAGASEPAVAEGRRGRSVAGAENGPGSTAGSSRPALIATLHPRVSIRRHTFLCTSSWTWNATMLLAGSTGSSAPPTQSLPVIA